MTPLSEMRKLWLKGLDNFPKDLDLIKMVMWAALLRESPKPRPVSAQVRSPEPGLQDDPHSKRAAPNPQAVL